MASCPMKYACSILLRDGQRTYQTVGLTTCPDGEDLVKIVRWDLSNYHALKELCRQISMQTCT